MPHFHIRENREAKHGHDDATLTARSLFDSALVRSKNREYNGHRTQCCQINDVTKLRDIWRLYSEQKNLTIFKLTFDHDIKMPEIKFIKKLYTLVCLDVVKLNLSILPNYYTDN